VPKDFKVGATTEENGVTITKFVPQAESVADWSRMITMQIFHGMANVDPDRFGRSLKERWRASCAGGDAQRLDAGSENKYSFSVWLFLCPVDQATQKPETLWLKIIGGRDAVYAVQYAYRQPMSPELMGPAMEYLNKVTVCDTRLPDRPCPSVR
jgi:hypothetical protein